MQPYYYRSTPSQKRPPLRATREGHIRRHFMKTLTIFVVIALVATGSVAADKYFLQAKTITPVKAVIRTKVAPVVAPTGNQYSAAPVAPVVNHCATNSVSKVVLVSISARHLWACQGTQELYNSPVVTGISYLAADLTPPGTYHVYDKVTHTVLTGSDSTGSWNDPVSYWMPFLDNQYGAYGFHDATWRPNSAFGNISPNSANGSHGCVELPLATAAWLYSWVDVGTTVTITS